MDEGHSQIFNAKSVVQQKDAFLYALITCPSLRLEVAKIYLLYYPQQMKAIETGPVCVVKATEEFLYKFSVQIFTVNPVVTFLTQGRFCICPYFQIHTYIYCCFSSSPLECTSLKAYIFSIGRKSFARNTIFHNRCVSARKYKSL